MDYQSNNVQHNINTQTDEVVKASSVVGVKVKNQLREDLGKIEEIMINKVGGTIRYVVLSFGGFLGIGDKLFALPWNAISYDQADECFILNIDKERLKNAPGFDKNSWPNMADTKWADQIKTYYETRY